MIRGMDRAQAQYDAMEPPDCWADATEGDESDPDDERERRAEERAQDEEAHWAREANE